MGILETSLKNNDTVCSTPHMTVNVDPLITVGTARRVPRVDNTDDGQTAAAGQHWTGALKHRLSAHY